MFALFYVALYALESFVYTRLPDKLTENISAADKVQALHVN